jgi:hypothetical protein
MKSMAPVCGRGMMYSQATAWPRISFSASSRRWARSSPVVRMNGVRGAAGREALEGRAGVGDLGHGEHADHVGRDGDTRRAR